MEAVAHLDEDFSWIQVVGSAKRETIVEQNAAVGHIDALDVDGVPFAEAFSNEEVERGVRLEMVARNGGIPVGESRSVVDVRGSVDPPRQSVQSADMQRIALVVIEQLESVTKGEVGEAAVDVTETKSQLIRVGHVYLAAVANAWGTHGKLPPVDARPLNGDGKEHIGVVEIIVVKEVFGASKKVVGVESPTPKGNGDSELVFLVTLPVERNESQVLIGDQLHERTGGRAQRRRLVEMAIEATENPLQLWNVNRRADR